MESLLWILFLLLLATCSVAVGTNILVKRLMKSFERDSSKVQALLAEIRDTLGK